MTNETPLPRGQATRGTNIHAPRPAPWKWYWRVDSEGRADCGVFYEERPGMAYSICRAPQFADQKQWEAEARLITAAPELLKACKFAYDVGMNGGDRLVMVSKLHSAIAKAEGKPSPRDPTRE